MKTMLAGATDRSLVLIDEFGSGTEPTIGGAIAEAILERLLEKAATASSRPTTPTSSISLRTTTVWPTER